MSDESAAERRARGAVVGRTAVRPVLLSPDVTDRSPLQGRAGFDDDQGGERSVLGRAVVMLRAFDAETSAMRLKDICDRTGLPRSTVHRTAKQLVDIGWLERTGDEYRLGMGLFELGGLVTRRSRLRDLALPFMEDLYEATHEVVQLAVLDHRDVVYLDKIIGYGAISIPTRVGGRFPVHCSALGKAMLAFAGDDSIAAYIEGGLDARTGSSITSPELFRNDLARVRSIGVAFDREEAAVGLACVAAPIRGDGRALAALSISGVASCLNLESLAPAVQTAARGIWRALFPRPAAPGRSH